MLVGFFLFPHEEAKHFLCFSDRKTKNIAFIICFVVVGNNSQTRGKGTQKWRLPLDGFQGPSTPTSLWATGTLTPLSAPSTPHFQLPWLPVPCQGYRCCPLSKNTEGSPCLGTTQPRRRDMGADNRAARLLSGNGTRAWWA